MPVETEAGPWTEYQSGEETGPWVDFQSPETPTPTLSFPPIAPARTLTEAFSIPQLELQTPEQWRMAEASKALASRMPITISPPQMKQAAEEFGGPPAETGMLRQTILPELPSPSQMPVGNMERISQQISMPELTAAIGPENVSALTREAYNLATAIPDFFTSLPGLASVATGRYVPRLTTGFWTGDMIRNMAGQIRDTYQNWSQMAMPDKIKAVVDMLGTGLMTGALAKTTISGIKPTMQQVSEFLRPEETPKTTEAPILPARARAAARLQPPVQPAPPVVIQPPAITPPPPHVPLGGQSVRDFQEALARQQRLQAELTDRLRGGPKEPITQDEKETQPGMGETGAEGQHQIPVPPEPPAVAPKPPAPEAKVAPAPPAETGEGKAEVAPTPPAAEAGKGEGVEPPSVAEIQAMRKTVQNSERKLRKMGAMVPPPIRAEVAAKVAEQRRKLDAMESARIQADKDFKEQQNKAAEQWDKEQDVVVSKIQRGEKVTRAEIEKYFAPESHWRDLATERGLIQDEPTQPPPVAAVKVQNEVAKGKPKFTLTFQQFLQAPREGELLDALRTLPKREKTAEEVSAIEATDKAYAALDKANLTWMIDHPEQGRNLSKAKQKIWDNYNKAWQERQRVEKAHAEEAQKFLYDEMKKAGMIEEPTPAAPAPGTKEGMPPGPGAQTAGTDVPPGAQIEQLSQAFRQITAQKTPLLQKIKEAFDLGKKRELSQNLIARTLSALKTSGDYLIETWKGQRSLDPILKAKGELSAELETRGWRLRQAMKDMKRAVPSKAAREAISKYVDAGGDMEKLRQSAETVPSGRRAPYIRAMQLTPDEKVIAGHIQSFFEARLQEAIDAGVLSHGIEDYIHRIYPQDTEWRRGVINAVQNSLLDTRTPGLAKQRVFELDADAERAGHFPVSDFIPRILDYEASLSKVIASRAAVKKFTEIKMPDGRPMLDVSGIGVPIENAEGIREATLIKPSFKPGEAQFDDAGRPTKNFRKDYQSRDYPALKKWKWATNDAEGNPIFVQGDVLIHPDAVHRVDALLEPSKVRRYAAARAALTVGSVFKQTMLDFSGFHQVQIAIHGLEHKVNPFNLVKDVDTNHPDVQGLLKGGMTLGGQHVSGMYQEGLAGRSLSRQIPGIGQLMQSYHDWLFQNFIPRVKTTMALHALERNRGRFAKELTSGQMTQDALYHQTAKEANAAFGEQNYIMLERSKTAQDMARLILLAPDFLEARGRFALQAGTRLGGEQRMALLLGAVTLYTTARLMNKALNDEWHFEPENMFSVIHNGKAYSIRTVQGDILHALESPVRFWMHRLNPALSRPLFELITQRDEFGRKRSFWQVMGDTISNAVPISMRASREQSIWTSLLNAFGGSVRRDSDISRVYQEATKWKAKNGIRTEPGEFIYDSSKDIYRPLKLALLDGDTEGAAREYGKLIASKVVTPAQALKHFQTYAHAPFSGAKKNERRFYESLTKDQQHAYQGAKQEKERILQSFLKARQLVPQSQIPPWMDFQPD